MRVLEFIFVKKTIVHFFMVILFLFFAFVKKQTKKESKAGLLQKMKRGNRIMKIGHLICLCRILLNVRLLRQFFEKIYIKNVFWF